MYGEVINTRIKTSESTTLSKLSILDQFKLLMHKMNNEDVAELNAIEKMSAVNLRMKASLIKLFKTATKGFDDGVHDSVTLQLSSKYIPYLDDVIDQDRGLGKYYNFEVFKKDLPPNVDFIFVVRVSRKIGDY